MDPFATFDCCTEADKIVCRCLQVTESEVSQVVKRLELRTVKEIRREIGAGDGCTCCHPELLQVLAKVSRDAAACAR
jgi:bacterioferritin-associated ferredoxin